MLLRALQPPAPVDGGYLQALRSEVSAVMEPRVLRSYSLNDSGVEVRPLPNAQSVATPGPNPQALEVGARRLVWPTRTRGRWHSCTHPWFVLV